MYDLHIDKFTNLVVYASIMVIVVCLVSQLPLAYSDNNNPSLFSKDSSPYGVSNSDWSIKWWKWLMQIPQEQNPANDPTGAHCAINQTEKNVWFTTGTLSGSAERTCKIPAGKAIFLGDGIECSTIENPEAKTDEQLKKCATDAMLTFRDPASLKATLDGVPLKNLSQYRVKSQAFDVNFPAHNIWGVKGGLTRSAADTYFIFLKPLSSGNHVFTFSGSSPVIPPSPLKPNPEPPHTLAIKYNLIVGK